MRKFFYMTLLVPTFIFAQMSSWVDVLCWKSTASPVPYVTVTGDLPGFPGVVNGSFGHVQQQATVPGYSWGVGGGVGWSECVLDVRLQGLWMRTTNHSSTQVEELSGVFPLIVVGSPNGPFPATGKATNRLRNQYWNIRGQTGYSSSPAPCLNLRFFGGGRYVNLRQAAHSHINLSSLSPAGSVIGIGIYDFLFSGGGVEAGLGGSWLLGWNLQLCTELGLSAVIGPTRSRLNSSTILIGNLDLDLFRSTTVVPGLDALLEIRASQNWFGLQWEGAIGYQLNHYWSVFKTWNVATGVIIFSQTRSIDSGFAGPYFSLGARF